MRFPWRQSSWNFARYKYFRKPHPSAARRHGPNFYTAPAPRAFSEGHSRRHFLAGWPIHKDQSGSTHVRDFQATEEFNGTTLAALHPVAGSNMPSLSFISSIQPSRGCSFICLSSHTRTSRAELVSRGRPIPNHQGTGLIGAVHRRSLQGRNDP